MSRVRILCPKASANGRKGHQNSPYVTIQNVVQDSPSLKRAPLFSGRPRHFRNTPGPWVRNPKNDTTVAPQHLNTSPHRPFRATHSTRSVSSRDGDVGGDGARRRTASSKCACSVRPPPSSRRESVTSVRRPADAARAGAGLAGGAGGSTARTGATTAGATGVRESGIPTCACVRDRVWRGALAARQRPTRRPPNKKCSARTLEGNGA